MATTTITAVDRSLTHGTVASSLNSRASSPDVGDHRDGTTATYFVLSDGTTVDKVIVGHNAIYQSRTNGVVAHVGFWDEAGNFGGWDTHALPSLNTTYTRTYYVSNSGNDANAGTDIGAPKLTIVSAITALQAAWSGTENNRILLERDDSFGVTGASSTYLWNMGTRAGSMLFGAYGTGAKPILTFADDNNNGEAFAVGSLANCKLTVVDIELVGDVDTGTIGSTNHLFELTGASAGGFYLHDVLVTSCAGIVSGPSSDFGDRELMDFAIGWRNVDVTTYGGGSANSHLMFGFHWARYGLIQDCYFGACNEAGHEGFVRGGGWKDWCFDNIEWDRTGGSSQGNILRIGGGEGTDPDDVATGITVHRCRIRGTEGIELDPVGPTFVAYGEIEFHANDVATTGAEGFVSSPYRCCAVRPMPPTVVYEPTIEWWRIRACSGYFETREASLVTFDSNHATGFERIIIEQCTAVLNGDGASFAACGVLFRQLGTGIAADAVLARNNYAVCLGTGAAGSGAYAAAFRTVASAATLVDNASDHNHFIKNGSGLYFCRDNTTNRALTGVGGWQATIGGSTDANSSMVNTGTHLLTNVTFAGFDARPTSALASASKGGAAGIALFDADYNLFDATTPDAGAFQFGGADPDGPELGGSPSDGALLGRGGTMRMRLGLR